MARFVVTGGAGFIGSHFIRQLLKDRPDATVINIDALTYAGNLENLRDVEGNPRYSFCHGSIVDPDCVDHALRSGVDAVFNFAAESHVDRSIQGTVEFARTNLQGVVNILEAIRRRRCGRLVQISTDEVYGALPPEGMFTESTPLHPNNPYSATKAAADLMVQSFVRTHSLNAVITRSSNNYGTHQFPEKFIPLFVSNMLAGKPCPLYGDGMQIRDWLHVEDNCRGIWAAFENGKTGEVYNLGGGNERPNLIVARAMAAVLEVSENLIQTVKDRPGHDRRYAIDSSKARNELGWAPRVRFDEGLRDAVLWYRDNQEWIRRALARVSA